MKGRNISKTLFFYILKDILLAFSVSFLFFFFVFFVNQLLLVAQDILTKQVPLYQVALLLLYAIPQVIAMAVPFASLMGTLITVGRLSSDNEVLVILSSGMSYFMVFLPAFIVGLLVSVFSFLANDILLPAGTVQFQSLYRSILVSTPALELEADSVTRYRDTVIVTGPVAGTSINNLIILDRSSDGERRVIMAESAEFIDSGEEGISLDLGSAFFMSSRETSRSDYDYASSSSLRYWVPQEDLIQAIHSIGPNQMSSRDLHTEIQLMNDEHYSRMDERYNRVMVAAHSLEDTLRRGSEGEYWNRRDSFLGSYIQIEEEAVNVRGNLRLRVYLLQYYQKFSIPFGALSFVLLAVSLGLLTKKSGQTVGFFMGLIISVLFWALLLGGQTLGVNRGYSPVLLMWFPNILALSSGLVLSIIRLKR